MGLEARENERDTRTHNLELREMRFGKCFTGRQTKDERRAAALAMAVATGMRLSDVGGILGHSTSDASAIYLDIARDKSVAAAKECSHIIIGRVQERLAEAMFQDEPAADVRNPFLEPVSSLRPAAAAEPSPLTRVYDDMTRTDSLAAHLLALDAQLGEEE
jgi:hypothetical protein